MSKPSTARADLLRALREHKYGHLQAKAESEEDKAERLAELRRSVEQKMRPYAGKHSKGIEPEKKGPRSEAQKAKKNARDREQSRLKYKRRTALPKDSDRE